MHTVVLPLTCMFTDHVDMIEQEAQCTKTMWLKQIRCPVNDWLRANTTAPYQIWKLRVEPADWYDDPKIEFKFEDAGDAMRFKLTWAGA